MVKSVAPMPKKAYIVEDFLIAVKSQPTNFKLRAVSVFDLVENHNILLVADTTHICASRFEYNSDKFQTKSIN